MNVGCDYFIELRKGYNKGEKKKGKVVTTLMIKGDDVIWFCLEMYVMSNVC